MKTLPVDDGVAASNPIAGQLSLAINEQHNLITVVGCGLWSSEYVEAHIKKFELILMRARQNVRPLRTLVDLRDAAVQTPKVAAMLHQAMSQMYVPPERAALLVKSNLVAMQMKRGFNPATHGVFLSEQAAEAWLHPAGMG